MFRGSVKSTGYPLHSTVSPWLPLPCVTVCHHISTGLYDAVLPQHAFIFEPNPRSQRGITCKLESFQSSTRNQGQRNHSASHYSGFEVIHKSAEIPHGEIGRDVIFNWVVFNCSSVWSQNIWKRKQNFGIGSSICHMSNFLVVINVYYYNNKCTNK